jgi:PAS domain S-box-containing protein
LALDCAELGTWSLQLNTGHFENDVRDRRIHGHGQEAAPKTLAEMRSQVHPDDLSKLDAAFVRNAGGSCTAEYRLAPRTDQERTGRERWVTLEGTVVRRADGRPEQLLGVTRDITERKLAELALAERNTQLELASKTALVGSFAIDFPTGFVHLSPGCATIFGLPESTREISRDDARKLVHPEDLALLDGPRDEAFLKKQREFVARVRIIRANDREVAWIEARSLVFYDEGGQPLRLIAVIIDFTDRKIAEQALVERNILLALAGRAARVGNFAYDINTEVMQISADYAAIHGFPKGTTEIARSECLATIHPEDVEQVGLARSEAFRGRWSEYSAEYRIIRPGGEVRWVEIRCFITYDSNEHPKRVVGVSIDVTGHKQAEFRLAERNLQLAMAGNVGRVGSYAYDVNAEKLQVSEGYAAVHGLPEGTTEIALGEWRARVHPEDLDRVQGVHNQAVADKRREYSVEYRIVRSNGEVRWTERRCSIMYDGDAHPQRVVGVSIDVTERKQAEKQRNALNAELDHRVKNALATVSSVVSHTRQGRSSVPDFAAALEGRLRSMAATHELLSARWWEGVSLTDLLRRELAPYAARDNTELSGPEVMLRAEAGQAMAMVLLELATNAAKYGALSTKKGRVSIRWDRRLNGSPRSDLVLEWQEIGGPRVVAASNSSYGTSTIRDLIPYEFGGTVDLVFAPEGVRCRLELPSDWLSDAAHPGSGANTGAAAK